MRPDLIGALEKYQPSGELEQASLASMREFVRRSPTAFSRANAEGHVTASAIVSRPDASEFLLVWHRKLARWLQPGGHLEPPDDSVFAAALREAREETGIESFEFPIGETILDLDVHPIPAFGTDPPHLHYDIRHLFTVDSAQVATVEKARWFSLPTALAEGIDESLARALRKAALAVGSAPRAAHRDPRT